ncbi:MAG: diacylglycerol kinase family lipid kinase [Actinomycetota bacterium]|nr:diacylglycerol kinase family lipid kinase [Actinomycetota bacterium]
MRGLLIVNPLATSMSGTICDLVVRSLAGLVDVRVEKTRYRGHARELAAAACGELVIVLGGDGSINEVVNGVMSQHSGDAEPPLIAVLPGGGGNVFAQALGLPADAAAAIRKVREVIAAQSYQTIGLGLAGDRYFTFSAGLGMDAEVVRAVDLLRAAGRRESASLFLRTMVRQYYRTDRRRAALTMERDGQPPASDLFLTIITNRSPWTYFRHRAVLPVPHPDFRSGLDVLAMRQVRLSTIFYLVIQMMWIRRRPPRARDVTAVHGEESLTVRSARPIAFQVDGEYLGEIETVKFQFVPNALRVAA